DLQYCMDFDLWIKMTEKYKIKYSPQVFAALAVYPETKSASGGEARFGEIRRMVEGHGGGAAHIYYKMGLWHYQHDQMRDARRHFFMALQRGPRPVIRRRLIALILKSCLGARIVNLGRTARSALAADRQAPTAGRG
ncbi:MAG TPA: hypothetical protein VMT34_12425, partial [Aggregatilineales bacterium]|nr:hypothetical protein [Aggregatilineales bacterium]